MGSISKKKSVPISFECEGTGIENIEYTWEFDDSFFGSVSTGLIQATPGEIKSFRSSADRMALIVADAVEAPPEDYQGKR